MVSVTGPTANAKRETAPKTKTALGNSSVARISTAGNPATGAMELAIVKMERAPANTTGTVREHSCVETAIIMKPAAHVLCQVQRPPQTQAATQQGGSSASSLLRLVEELIRNAPTIGATCPLDRITLEGIVQIRNQGHGVEQKRNLCFLMVAGVNAEKSATFPRGLARQEKESTASSPSGMKISTISSARGTPHSN